MECWIVIIIFCEHLIEIVTSQFQILLMHEMLNIVQNIVAGKAATGVII